MKINAHCLPYHIGQFEDEKTALWVVCNHNPKENNANSNNKADPVMFNENNFLGKSIIKDDFFEKLLLQCNKFVENKIIYKKSQYHWQDKDMRDIWVKINSKRGPNFGYL